MSKHHAPFALGADAERGTATTDLIALSFYRRRGGPRKSIRIYLKIKEGI